MCIIKKVENWNVYNNQISRLTVVSCKAKKKQYARIFKPMQPLQWVIYM